MKGHINENGWLEVTRGGEKTKALFCPYGEDESRCGDWCPMFNEPEFVYGESVDRFYIELCNNKLKFTNLMDNRGEE